SNMSHPENCTAPDTVWDRSSTGVLPPLTGGLVFGSEFNAFEQPSLHQKVSLDLRLIADYVGPGRYYNEMSAILRKLLYTDDYLKVGGSIGINAHASD